MRAVFVALLLLAVCLQQAFAAGVVATIPSGWQWGKISRNVWFDTPQEACQSQAAYQTSQSSNGTSYSFVSIASGDPAQTVCNVSIAFSTGQTGSGTVTTDRKSAPARCPSGATMTGAQCVCNDPLVPDAQAKACIPPPDKCKGTEDKNMGSGTFLVQGSRPSKVCENGCEYLTNDGWEMSGTRDGKSYHWLSRSAASGTGKSCEGSEQGGPGDELPEPAPTPPPPGQCPGTVNGVTVYVRCDSSTSPSPGGKDTTKPPTTTPAPNDGSEPTNGPPGTTNKSGQTTCTDDKCTTTDKTTTTNPDGSTTTTEDTKTESRDEFCAKNPGSVQCKDKESQWGGSCGAFSCNGDAIQCAMAREQHQRNCQLFDTPNPLSDAGNAAMSGGLQPPGHPGAAGSSTAIALSSMINTAPMFGSNGSCPQDVTVGRWVLKFSAMCGNLQVIGVALQAFAMLIACFIVFRKGV